MNEIAQLFQSIKTQAAVSISLILTSISDLFGWISTNAAMVSGCIGIVVGIATLRGALIKNETLKLENKIKEIELDRLRGK